VLLPGVGIEKVESNAIKAVSSGRVPAARLCSEILSGRTIALERFYRRMLSVWQISI